MLKFSRPKIITNLQRFMLNKTKCLYLTIVVCFLFGVLGYLDAVIKILDSELLTFKFATVSFSVYKLIKSVFLIILFFWVAQSVNRVGAQNIKRLSKLATTNRAILTKIFQIFVYFTFFIIILDLHGIDLSAFAFLGGAVGIGIGFGLQKITSNFLSGIILLFEKSIKEGDLIEISTGIYGFIKHTGARHTLVETFNGQEIMIPNDEFITNRVTNWTHSNNRGRMEIKVRVTYDADIEKARELMIGAASDREGCSKSILPQCYLAEFADSSIELLLFFWLENITHKRIETKSDVMRSILRGFKENNIEMALPQYEVKIKSGQGGIKKKARGR